jgi:hypothetical protein
MIDSLIESPVYITGDIFIINNKEYRLRYINQHQVCWLEPVIARHLNRWITGGRNVTCNYDELSQLELVYIESGR